MPLYFKSWITRSTWKLSGWALTIRFKEVNWYSLVPGSFKKGGTWELSCWALTLSLLLPCLPHPSDVSTLFIFKFFTRGRVDQDFHPVFNLASSLLVGLLLDHKSSNYIRLSFFSEGTSYVSKMKGLLDDWSPWRTLESLIAWPAGE